MIARETAESLADPPRRWTRWWLRYLAQDKVAAVALIFVLVILLLTILAPWVAPYDPLKINLRGRNAPPTLGLSGGQTHLLGTDHLGRNVLSRLMHGGRVSLAVGASAVALSGTFGTVLGLLAGYYGRRLDGVIMRLVELQMAFPAMLLALAVLFAVGGSFVAMIFTIGFLRWMVYARITRGVVLALRSEPIVEAARALGCRDHRVILRHILPELGSPLITISTLEMARAVLLESSLSFLGVGIRPPNASWGLMLAEGPNYVHNAPWLIVFPGLAILLTTLSFNLVASWFHTVIDPLGRTALFKEKVGVLR